VNPSEEPAQNREAQHRVPKPAAVRYAVALAAAAAGLLVMVALDEWNVTDQPVYAPLLAAVALTSLYGGFGPSAVVVVASWGGALLLFDGAVDDWTFTNTQEFVRWWINLAVALLYVIRGNSLSLATTPFVNRILDKQPETLGHQTPETGLIPSSFSHFAIFSSDQPSMQCW